MPRFDVHAHFMPASLMDDPERIAALVASERFVGAPPGGRWSPEVAIEFMDQRGIQLQMLSLPQPMDLDQLRAANESGARLVAEHPDRFGLLASLPMTDPEAAVAEIHHACDELGADGFVFTSNYAGAYFGDPRFEPVFAELDRRGASVFVHPVNPAPFDDLCLGRPGPLVEFPMDTARAITDALFAGVFLRYPRMNWILAHGGGVLPALSRRIVSLAGESWMPNPNGISPARLREQLESLYFETAIAGEAVSLVPALSVSGPDHLIFGTDFPPAGLEVIDGNIAALTSGQVLAADDLDGMDQTFHRLFPAVASRLPPARV